MGHLNLGSLVQLHPIRQRQPIALPPRQKSLPKQSTTETNPTNCWQFPVLCASSGSYYINGTVGNSLTISGTNWEYNEMCQSISWSHVDRSRCNYCLPCLWHASQCSFWCVVPLCTKSSQPHWWLLLPWQYPTRWRSNKIEWSHSYHMSHPQACCCIRSKSRTGCTFPECTWS